MPKLEGFTGLVPGYQQQFDSLNEAQVMFDSQMSIEPGTMLWFDKDYGRTAEGQLAVALLHAVSVSPELLATKPLSSVIETTSTGARTVNIAWSDWGGDCYMNIKGSGAVVTSQSDEGKDNLNWQIQRRRPVGWNQIAAGKLLVRRIRM
jgi:hypothetical protein